MKAFLKHLGESVTGLIYTCVLCFTLTALTITASVLLALIGAALATPAAVIGLVVDAGWVLMRGPATAERLLIARDVRFGGESGGMATVIVDTPWVKTRQGIVGAEIALRDLHAPNHPNGNERKLGRPWGPHVICRQLPKSVELGKAWGPQLGPRVVVADGFDLDLSQLQGTE